MSSDSRKYQTDEASIGEKAVCTQPVHEHFEPMLMKSNEGRIAPSEGFSG